MNLPVMLSTAVQCPQCGSVVPVTYAAGGGVATAEKTTATATYAGTCTSCRASVQSTVTARAPSAAELLRETQATLDRMRSGGAL